MKTAIDFAAYALVRLIVAVIQTLPLDMGDAMCRFLAWMVGEKLRIRRRETDENLALIFPDADDQQRRNLRFAMWHHLLLMVCEIAWAQRRLHLANWTKHVRFRNNREMLGHMLSKRPTVIVTGHFGNFEVGGYMTGLMGIQTLTIARQLDNRFIHAWVDRFRSAKGQVMVDKEGCATEVDRHLNNGGILSLLADQHAGPKGCWVHFMGAPASCHKALSLFSLSSNAPMIVGATRRIGGQPMQFEISSHAIADPLIDRDTCESVTSLTNWYNAHLESAVNESIEQYWWLHRRWRKPPERVARRLAA
ncbi:MAG: lysophospholipid acyltransferase family protein [Rubripirellula sp.]